MKTFPNPLPVKIVDIECEVDGVIERRFTALYEGNPAGTVAVRTIQSRQKTDYGCTYVPRKVAYLYQLYVHELLRKHGVGRELMKAACLHAEIKGCTAISLNVSTGNAEVLPFYAKLGFVPGYQDYDGTLFLCRQLHEWNPQPPPPANVTV